MLKRICISDTVGPRPSDRRPMNWPIFAPTGGCCCCPPWRVPIGVISALVAKALLWLIAVITNLAFFHRFSAHRRCRRTITWAGG